MLVLLPILALLPPETRGESMTAAAALMVVVTISAWRVGGKTAGQMLMVVTAVLAIPLARFALAPGAAVWLPALALFAASAGLSVATLRRFEGFEESVSKVLAVAGGLVSLHSLYQRLWGFERMAAEVASDPALPDREAMLVRLGQGRAFAAFSTPAAMGGFLAMTVPVTLVLVVRMRGRWRFVWATVLTLQLAGLLAAASLTAIVALLGALVFAALLSRVRGRTTWIAVTLALALLATVALVRGSEVLTTSHPNSPWRLRAGNYVAAWSMALDHPWMGVGPGGFAESYPAYRKPGDNETRHVHNLPLELCAELGFPGGAAVSTLFFVVFLGPLALLRRGGDPWRRAIAIGLAAFALQNLADFTAFLPSLLWIACILRGVVAPSNEPADRPQAGPGGRVLSGASLVVAFVSILVVACTGVAENARMASRFAAFQGDAGRAERLARRAVIWAPWSPDAALLFARTAMLGTQPTPPDSEQLVEALDRVERAVRLSPVRPAARELRSQLRLLSGDFPGALADMIAASRLYPHNREYAQRRNELEVFVREAIDRAESGDAEVH